MCILCDNWDATPYSKRPTTDISTNTGHELLLLGFYLGAMATGAPELPVLCAEHEGILQQIGDFKDKQAAAQAALAAQAPPQIAIEMQDHYKSRIAKLNVQPPPPAKPIPQRFTAQQLIQAAVPSHVIAEQPPIIQPIPPAPKVDPTFRFECPNCKKMVTNGEIHDCVFTP